MFLLAAPVLTACAGVADGIAGTNVSAPAKVELSTGTVNLTAVGASEALTISVRDAAGTVISAPKVSWSSDDITVADVAGSGTTAVITARAPGRTVVRAHVGTLSLEVAVAVLAVRTITIAPLAATIRAGDPQRFTTSLDADYGAVTALRWSSTDPSVASANSDGVVTGVTPGSTVIRVQSIADPRVVATAQLFVTTARSVALASAASTLWVGDHQTVPATIDVDSTESRALSWSSDNASVASVAGDGTITALTIGRTVIRAFAVADPRARDSLIMTVLPARSVTIDPEAVALGAGESRLLRAQVTIESGLSTDVIWRSANPSVAIIGQTGQLTAVAMGTTTISAIAVADTTRRATATVTVVPVVRDLEVTPAAVSIFTGETRQLAASVSADAGLTRAVLWRSGNPAVASVSATGLVSGVAAGTAMITVIAQADTTQRVTALITVRAAPTVTVSPSSVTLGLGEQRALSAAVQAEAGVSTEVRWRTSNAAIASVSASGVVTAVAYGATTVSAISLADSTRRAVATIIVSPAVSSMAITPSASTMVLGEIRRLAATVLGDVGVSTAVIWRTSNPAIASISGLGDVTALAVGSATITAIAAGDTTQHATATVTVVPVVRDLEVTPAAVSIFTGETRQLAASVSADAGLTRAVLWRSGNPAVASVSATGLVSGVAAGTAMITVIAQADTTQRVTALITVRAAPTVTVSPSSVTLGLGEQRALSAAVQAEAGVSTEVRWRTSNAAIASVSASGVVTAVAYGATTVSAISLADSTRRAVATIIVSPAVSSMAITPSASTMVLGEIRRLAATVLGDVGVSTAVIWRTSNPAIASISGLGDVTALAVGSATITAIAAGDTTQHATATVTVRTAPTVVVAPGSLILSLAEQRTLVATVTADQGLSTAVTWRSSNAAVASVTTDGEVTATGFGTTTVVAISQADTTRRASSTVTVQPIVQAVSVAPASAAILVGQTVQLSPTVSVQGSLSAAVSYRSSNEAVAVVSTSGVVTARAAGGATITVLSVADTTKLATSTISVSSRPVTVSITQGGVTVMVGGTAQLTAAVAGDPGISTQVTWTSAAPSVATVSSGGVVRGVAAGSALITATSVADVTKRDTVTVAVGSRLATSWTASRLGGALVEDVVSIRGFDGTTAFAVNQDGDVYRWNGSLWTLAARGASFGTQFLAVHGSSSSNVVAVGTGGVIVRFNGNSWTATVSGTARRLNGVFMESATNGFAVGANGTALRWNGTAWSITTTGSTQTLNSIWVSGASAFAVGDNGEILRYANGAWTRQSSPTTESLLGVSGQSTANVVAVGTFGTVLSFNGTTWRAVNTGGITADLHAVSSVSATDARMYIASDDGVLLLNGGSLTHVTTPYAPLLFSVSTDPAGNVWASGQRGSTLRMTGSTWSTVSLAPDLIDVWSTSASNSWAVGEFGFVYRWNGSTWSRQTTPTTATLSAVWGATSTEAFAGGDNGTMLRFNGTSWATMSFPSTASIYAIWGSSASNVYAVTSAGEIVHFNGGAWSTVTTAGSALWAIHGTSANDVIATGEIGTALRFTGSSWRNVAVSTSGTLAGVWSSGTGATSVGESSSGTGGIAFGFNGSTWSSVNTGSSRVLTSVWGTGVSDLYATGEQGTLLRFDGTNWSAMSSGTTDLLWSVTGSPSGAGGAFAVGYNSTIATGASASGFTASMSVTGRTASGADLNPAVGARLVRGALPTGAARKTRRTTRR